MKGDNEVLVFAFSCLLLGLLLIVLVIHSFTNK